jgi:hypothetical protein
MEIGGVERLDRFAQREHTRARIEPQQKKAVVGLHEHSCDVPDELSPLAGGEKAFVHGLLPPGSSSPSRDPALVSAGAGRRHRRRQDRASVFPWFQAFDASTVFARRGSRRRPPACRGRPRSAAGKAAREGVTPAERREHEDFTSAVWSGRDGNSEPASLRAFSPGREGNYTQRPSAAEFRAGAAETGPSRRKERDWPPSSHAPRSNR